MFQIFSRARAFSLALITTCLFASPAFAGGPLKVGYLDLNKIKQQYPEAAQAENARLQAEMQLVDVVSRANQTIVQAQKENKPAPEIEKMKQELQLQVQGMQQGIKLMLDHQTSAAYSKISFAANAVAKDKGIDLVVDSNMVFAGQTPLSKNGEDLTDSILQKLLAQQPATHKQSATEAKP